MTIDIMTNDFINFIHTLRWQDFLDIAINSFIVFRLYILFRGTHSFKVMLVVTGLWFAQRLAYSLDLIVTSWVIQGITAALAIIIIVVFRSEIRTIFQTKSIGAILWELPRRKKMNFIDILPEAVFELAAGRTGALIVFGGQEDISEITQGGIRWQGLVSKEMVKSIFWRNNPVHDGAAIVEGDRIAAVGCVLPLSLQNDLPTNFGTRHRAALGLAEVTDALVVLVSEESGKVLVFKDAQYREIKNTRDLKRILIEHNSGPESAKGIFESEGLRLATAALFSLLMVTIVWNSITRGQNTLITYEVPIKYINQQTGMDIFETSVDNIILHLSGPAPLIKRLQPSEVQLEIDLKKAKIGKNSMLLKPADVILPPGIRLERITPQTIDVMIDTYITKQVPVQVNWTGALPEDKLLTQSVLEPGRLKVRGPSLKLKELSTIYTKPVILNGLIQNGRILTKPDLPAYIELLPNQKDMIIVDYKVTDR